MKKICLLYKIFNTNKREWCNKFNVETWNKFNSQFCVQIDTKSQKYDGGVQVGPNLNFKSEKPINFGRNRQYR